MAGAKRQRLAYGAGGPFGCHPPVRGVAVQIAARGWHAAGVSDHGHGERLSAIDASFLQLESGSAHMHVAWSSILAPREDGPRPTLRVAHAAARAVGTARRGEAACLRDIARGAMLQPNHSPLTEQARAGA